MKSITEEKSRKTISAMAGISERSGRAIDKEGKQGMGNRIRRRRTRKDPSSEPVRRHRPGGRSTIPPWALRMINGLRRGGILPGNKFLFQTSFHKNPPFFHRVNVENQGRL